MEEPTAARPPLWWWLLAGPLAGAAVMAIVCGAVFSVENGSVWVDDPEFGGRTLAFTIAVMVLGGMFGSVCGFLVGLVCALVTSWWSRTGRAGGPVRYAWLAAAVTAVVCTAFCALMFARDIDEMTVAELVTWWVAPTATATGAAAIIGAAIWARGTPPGEILA